MRTIERLNFTGEAATDLKRLQDATVRALDPVVRVPTLDGVLLGPIALTTTLAPVNHGLGRAFLGWQVVRINASATVWEDFAATQQTASISMRASVACSIYLWVF